jgi:alpha-galactosidase
LIETCSSGGGRFDPGMLYYSPQIWTSDDTDAIERLKIQCGTSIVYPFSSMGSHVSAIPNHQTNRMTELSTRGLVAFAGTFGYELDLNKLSDTEKEEIKRQVKLYKQHYDIINYGYYYRIENPYGNSNFSAWCFVSEDQSELLFECVQIRSVPNQPIKRIKIPVADVNKIYYDEKTGKRYTGSVLKNVGINIINGEMLPTGYFQNYGDGTGFIHHFITEK